MDDDSITVKRRSGRTRLDVPAAHAVGVEARRNAHVRCVKGRHDIAEAALDRRCDLPTQRIRRGR